MCTLEGTLKTKRHTPTVTDSPDSTDQYTIIVRVYSICMIYSYLSMARRASVQLQL